MLDLYSQFAVVVVAYLLGSIPFSIIVGKWFFGVDVRNSGSGNPGATNVLRTLGPKAGIIVLLLDMLKGAIPVLFVKYYQIRFPAGGGEELSVAESAFLTGFAAVCGHIFSVFLFFKGGKGVATTYGALLALSWLGVAAGAVFLLIVVITRYVSLGSLLSLAFFTIFLILFPSQSSVFQIILSLFLLLIITVKHKQNIFRLMAGSENKINLKSTQ